MKQYCIKILFTKEYNKVVKLTLTFLFWSGFCHILGGLMSGGLLSGRLMSCLLKVIFSSSER